MPAIEVACRKVQGLGSQRAPHFGDSVTFFITMYSLILTSVDAILLSLGTVIL
jgi:hypothetical protein